MFNMTHYSILQAVSKPAEVITKLKELDYKVAIICDTEMFGTLEFYYKATAEGLKPIISVQKTIDNVNFVLIAKNANGYKNLSRMSNFETLTLDIALDYLEDVFVVFSFDNLNTEAVLAAKETLLNNGISPFGGKRVVYSIEDSVKNALIDNLELPNIPLEFSKYVNKEDYRNKIAVEAIGEKGLYENYSLRPDSKEEFIKPKSYWSECYPKELNNLSSILKECIDDYSFGNPVPPKYKFCSETAVEKGLPADTTEEELFAFISREGLKERLKIVDESKHQEYIERLEFEIDIINQMKFPGYMLIVWDFVIAAKQMGIPVGPGRGSAAGSLVAYSLFITDLDPMPYGLLFERFLNPERVSMPDIDMDFCQSRRGEIIQYVVDKYGEENVAQIITFGQMGGKSVIRDSGRILSYPLHLTDKLAKQIPETPGIKLKEAYEIQKNEIDAIISDDTHAQRVWKFSNSLEGTKRNLGVHAAGLVISDNNVTEKCPKFHVGDTQVVQYDGKYLEDVDLIKFDFLGLKTLSVIDGALNMIKENRNITLTCADMKFEKEVFDYISSGQTKGMFQIESDGMQDLAKRLQPDCFEDVIAMLALYRPGPMESGMLDDFIDRKKGKAEINYFFDDMTEALEPILKPTYGVIVYQEQVMQIVQEIGGFSLGGADLVRRAMGKKKKEEMDRIKGEFSQGAANKGYKKEEAEELFDLIVKFAGYGFNKSHSAAYALVTYYTAYLKLHYPVEFMASLMNFDYSNQSKLRGFIQESEQMGIKVNKPDIKTSTSLFSVKGNEIIYGLKGIKGIGNDIDRVISMREEEPFHNLFDFIKRNRTKSPKLNKRVITGLIASGSLESFATRAFLYENLDKLTSVSTIKAVEEFAANFTEDDLFASDLKNIEKIKLEKDFLGHILTSPFQDIQKGLDTYELTTFDDLIVGPNKIVCWIESFKVLKSKKGNKYSKLVIVDSSKHSKDVLAFESAINSLEAFGDLSKPIIASVRFKQENGEEAIFLNDIEVLNRQNMDRAFPKKKLEEVKNSEEKSIESIEIGDYESLLKVENAKKVSLTEDGRTIFTLIA